MSEAALTGRQKQAGAQRAREFGLVLCKYTSVEALDPVSGETVPLYHPRRQRWYEHFAWNKDYTVVLGLTSTERATVEKQQLNRAGVVNLRHVLRRIGAHPPADPAEP
jgi:hypothetical protein